MRYFEILTETQPAKDAADEEDRVFAAYLKKNRIDLTTLGRMNDVEREKLRADALENRNKYPVPVSESEYLYHGTSKARLPLIAHRGLLPSEKSRWNKDVGIGDWSIGKVFFTDTIRSASFYAREASKSRPIILRVKASNLIDAVADPKENDGFYIERTVPPNQIEVWAGKGWKPIAKITEGKINAETVIVEKLS